MFDHSKSEFQKKNLKTVWPLLLFFNKMRSEACVINQHRNSFLPWQPGGFSLPRVPTRCAVSTHHPPTCPSCAVSEASGGAGAWGHILSPHSTCGPNFLRSGVREMISSQVLSLEMWVQSFLCGQDVPTWVISSISFYLYFFSPRYLLLANRLEALSLSVHPMNNLSAGAPFLFLFSSLLLFFFFFCLKESIKTLKIFFPSK